MRIVFSKKYTVKDQGHVFRADKFEAALRRLLAAGLVSRRDVTEPARPSRRDLELAHTRRWAAKNLRCAFTPADAARAELELTPAVAGAHLMNVGGTILAARHALETGAGLNCGGGAHHAFRGRGGGFCLLNDLAVAITKLLKEGRIKRALVIDLDVHQGDGTAAIFRRDGRVFTFSMHQRGLYPEKKEKSSLDVELPAGTGDARYLAALKKALPGVIARARPGLAIYVAGADVYKGDLLGGLKLTMGGIRKRDAYVFRECRRSGLPVAVVLGGGYAKKFADTVRIHAGTLAAAIEAFQGVPPGTRCRKGRWRKKLFL